MLAFSRLKIAFAALVAVALASCAPPPPKQPDPTIAQLTLTAMGDANPDPSGRASPTVVYVYAMKAGAPFETAPSDVLLGGELGDLAQRMERIARIVVGPGKSRKEVFTLPDDTARIGVAADFRAFSTAAWRSAASIAPNSVTLLTATVTSNNISVE